MIALEAFLVAPIEAVIAVAPQTVMIAITGTRRAAVLAGKPFQGDEYVRWSRERVFDFLDLLFRHGIQHIVATTIVPVNLAEHAATRQRYLEAAVEGMAGAEARADYARIECRARLIASPDLHSLHTVDAELRQATAGRSSQTVWWHVIAGADDPWRMVFAAAQQAQTSTRADLLRALYGEDIPPATMFLGFGKPVIAPHSFPPLLVGDIQCYWSQRPGFSMDERMLRRILYDYAYVRPHGRRASAPEQQRAAGETDAVLGVGRRLGGFWYSAPFAALEIE
ncbi:MAG: hypothetical protein ACJ8CR_36290 [Roseiflexaceae bacterium]